MAEQEHNKNRNESTFMNWLQEKVDAVQRNYNEGSAWEGVPEGGNAPDNTGFLGGFMNMMAGQEPEAIYEGLTDMETPSFASGVMNRSQEALPIPGRSPSGNLPGVDESVRGDFAFGPNPSPMSGPHPGMGGYAPTDQRPLVKELLRGERSDFNKSDIWEPEPGVMYRR